MTGNKTMIKDKIPPHDIDSEESLIGSVLVDSSIMTDLMHRVEPEDFYSERTRFTYNACLNLYNRLEAIDTTSVAYELNRLNQLEIVGGSAFLTMCHANCPTSLDYETYADIVKRLSISRKLITLGAQLSDMGYLANPDVNETLTKISTMTDNFRKNNTVRSKIVTPIMAGNEIMDLAEKYTKPNHSLRWGFNALDEITAGIYTEYIVVGARPSIGKTELLLNIAENIVLQDKTILFASAEMMTSQIYERKLSREVGINILELRKHGLSDDKHDQILALAGRVSESKINYLSGGVYLNDIYREASIMLDKGALDIIFIDYLGALRDCYVEGKDNQNVRISRVSNRLQSMVHEFKVPIIVASQLNREIEKRGGESNKPQLSDLRDSGSIEQDADVVFLLHRDEMPDGTLSYFLKIKMAKHRQLGSHKSIELEYNRKTFRYEDTGEKRIVENGDV